MDNEQTENGNPEQEITIAQSGFAMARLGCFLSLGLAALAWVAADLVFEDRATSAFTILAIFPVLIGMLSIYSMQRHYDTMVRSEAAILKRAFEQGELTEKEIMLARKVKQYERLVAANYWLLAGAGVAGERCSG